MECPLKFIVLSNDPAFSFCAGPHQLCCQSCCLLFPAPFLQFVAPKCCLYSLLHLEHPSPHHTCFCSTFFKTMCVTFVMPPLTLFPLLPYPIDTQQVLSACLLDKLNGKAKCDKYQRNLQTTRNSKTTPDGNKAFLIASRCHVSARALAADALICALRAPGGSDQLSCAACRDYAATAALPWPPPPYSGPEPALRLPLAVSRSPALPGLSQSEPWGGWGLRLGVERAPRLALRKEATWPEEAGLCIS